MSEPKKQHYVPQVYLKNFSFGNGKSPKIFVLSLDKNKVYQSSIDDVAAERDFYTLENSENKYAWEKAYAKYVEPPLETIIGILRKRCENIFVQNGTCVLNEEEKSLLSSSIIFQALRGYYARNYEKKLYDKLLPGILEETKKWFSQLDKRNEEVVNRFLLTDKYFKEIAMEVTFREESILKYWSLLMQYKFIFCKIDGDEEYITSDNPAFFMNFITQKVGLFENGLISASTVLYYPLSPKLLLIAFHPQHLVSTYEEKDGCIKRISADKEKAFIHKYNAKQMEQCNNFVYGRNKELLENLLSERN